MEKLQGYKIDTQFFEEPLDLGDVRLIQIGRRFCTPDSRIGSHLHRDFFELTMINEGKGIVCVNNRRIPVGKNDVVISFPFDTHEIITDKDSPLEYDYLAFSLNNQRYNHYLQEITREFYDSEYRVIQDARINYLTYCILGEFPENLEMKSELIKNSILNIVVYMTRALNKQEDLNSLKHINEKQRICNRIMNHIDTHIYSIEKLQDLAQIAGYNYNYISTLFKQTTGMTLSKYLVDRKLEIAHMLLCEGQMKVHEIAEKLHYSDGSALAKAYKQKYGVSPKDHRQN